MGPLTSIQTDTIPLRVGSDLGVRSLLHGAIFVWYNFHNENKTNIEKKRKVK